MITKGPFQTHDLDLASSYQHIAEAIDTQNLSDTSIILGIGHCRSGTTFTMRLMGCSGILSYHQPFKTILRWMMQGQSYTWVPQQAPVMYVKETIGPYTLLESLFDPIQVVLRHPTLRKQNIHVVYIARDPYQALCSWVRQWGAILDSETLITNFIASYITFEQSRITALSEFGKDNIHHLAYDCNSEKIWRKLFSKLGMRNHPHLSGWSRYPEMGEKGSNVLFPPYGGQYREDAHHDVPFIFRQSMGSHKNAEKQNTITPKIYSDEEVSQLPKDYVSSIRQWNLASIYNDIREACIAELDSD